MKLTKLQLENFRNYGTYEYEFPSDKNIIAIVGENGRGKTNLLEAIHILSLGRSFRTIAQDDLIKWGNEYMRCKGEVLWEDEPLELEVFYSNSPIKQKNFKKNGVKMKNSEYIGNFLTVLFHPEDLNMLYLSPSLRRKYIDTVLCQTDKYYLEALAGYKKVLKHRNALLHKIREISFNGKNTTTLMEDLEVWDTEFLKFAEEIIKKREQFIKLLEEELGKAYRAISGGNEEIRIKYECSLAEPREENLKNTRKRDIFKAESSRGPHRDDIKFYINEKEITSSASRGEFRTLLLAIKTGEISYIQRKTSKKPVLLLDDVFSELDEKRQTHLLETMNGCQTIITSTEIKGPATDCLICKNVL